LVRPEDRATRDEANRTGWQRFADKWVGRFSGRACFRAHAVGWSVWFTIVLLLYLTAPKAPPPAVVSGTPPAPKSSPAREFATAFFSVDMLTNIVSLEAIILSIFILVAQRRKDEKDSSRENVQYTNTAITAEQSAEILRRLNEWKAELFFELRQARRRESVGAPPPPKPSS
jgi:uncharacterized membrane protein